MEDFITIATFTFPTEVAVIRSKLESEGIECYLKDEMTAQVHNFYSNAIGGVKLQVREKDVEKAVEILKSAGYVNESAQASSNLYDKLDRISKLPGLHKLSVEMRLLILLAAFTAILSLAFYYFTLPSTYELLTESTWCVNHVNFEGKDYRPNSTGLKISGVNYCDETINFRGDGSIILPGFNSSAVWGDWTLDENSIIISDVDDFDHIYQREFLIELDGHKLILYSEDASIYCYKLR